jgi:hypothetical protein
VSSFVSFVDAIAGYLCLMLLLRRYLSSMGYFLLGFLVYRLGVLVVSAGEEKISVRGFCLVTQWNEFHSPDEGVNN